MLHFIGWPRNPALFWWYIVLLIVNALKCMFSKRNLLRYLRPTREFFTHMETSPLPVKGCKFWHMLSTHGHWAVRFLNSVPHLLWHQFRMVIFEDPWHSHLLPSVWQWSCHYLFLWQVSCRWDSKSQPSACDANALTECATAVVLHFGIDMVAYFCPFYAR